MEAACASPASTRPSAQGCAREVKATVASVKDARNSISTGQCSRSACKPRRLPSAERLLLLPGPRAEEAVPRLPTWWLPPPTPAPFTKAPYDCACCCPGPPPAPASLNHAARALLRGLPPVPPPAARRPPTKGDSSSAARPPALPI